MPSSNNHPVASVSRGASVDADSRPKPKPLAPILTIGRGGWTIHFPTELSPRGNKSKSSLSHYGDTWREHLANMTPDAVGIDSTAIGEDDIVTYAISGPMVDPDLAFGMVLPFACEGGAPRPWHAEVTVEGRDPRFGDARGFDYVAPDVAAAIARRFGARVFNPHADAAHCSGSPADLNSGPGPAHERSEQ
jgi:hypothetical protein